MELEQLGTVHSPYRGPQEVPCCQRERLEEVAVVEVFRDFAEGLRDLDGFSHLMLIVNPPIDTEQRGVFATRSPMRPNHLGVSIVELIKVEGRNLLVKGIDLLDGTPVLDIKPYIPYDARSQLKLGWLEGKVSDKSPPEDE